VQISLLLDATRAEVVARAALHELLHQTTQHFVRDAESEPPVREGKCEPNGVTRER
jgi:hypothetical protein